VVWQLNNGTAHGTVGFTTQELDVSEIDSVLARFYGIATSAEAFQTKDGQYLSSEWHALIRGYIQNLACPVVNRLRPELWYKASLQVHELLSLVPDLAFRLPKSIITTRFDDARGFFALCGRRVRYSPLTLPSRYMIETEGDLQKLEPLSKVLPLYLTELVDGDRADVYVVGDRVIFDGASNAALGKRCKDTASALGLTFCQFHFTRTGDDEWYCTGMETMPHLLDCTDATREEVVGGIAELLGAGNGRKSK